MKKPSLLRSEDGSVFIYVMLMFAAASVIVAAMLEGEQLEFVQTSQFVHNAQAVEYAYGAELYARELLFADMAAASPAAGVKRWGAVEPAFTVPDGKIAMNIEDMTGRFNVNSLLVSDQVAENHFINLCVQFGVDDSVVEEALVHFRQQYNPTGAPPPADPGAATFNWLVDASELVDYGLPRDVYYQLAPYLAALPTISYTINVNVAPDVVLKAYIGDDMKIAAIHELIKKQGAIDQSNFATLAIADPHIGIGGDIFRMQAIVHMSDQDVRLNSTFIRSQDKNGNNKKILTIARSWGDAP